MLLPLLPLRAATLAITGWMAAAPGPTGDGARAEIAAAPAAAPDEVVTIELFDVNHRETATIQVRRDGSLDPASEKIVKRLLRCKRTERQHKIAAQTLAMFANVADHWPGHTIEIISGYRAMRAEAKASLHRAARAIDFKVRGVPIKDVRDYMWRNFRTVGVGYYPSQGYLHLDSRPGMRDTAWTFKHGENHYHPSWAERIRPAFEEAPRDPAKVKSKAKVKRSKRPHQTPLRHRGVDV